MMNPVPMNEEAEASILKAIEVQEHLEESKD
jgi:hypothetical protein